MAGDSKRQRAIRAAAELFIRHGYKRTTMGDIAAVAQMSRPALYLLFPDKGEVFQATVLHLNELLLANIKRALAKTDHLAARLYVVCDLWLIRVYELQASAPDARDMDDLAFPVVRRVYADLQALLAEVIAEAGGGGAGATPSELARSLAFGVRGLRATAADADEMRSLTRLQVDLFCAALERFRPALSEQT